MTKEKKIFQPILLKDVGLVYNLLYNQKLISFPLTKEGGNKIDSLITNITRSYFGKQIYKTNEEKAVAYLYFIIKDHPFIDGNKRMAVLIFEIVCKVNNLKPCYKDILLDQIAVFIEQYKTRNHHEFIRKLSNLIFNP